MMIGSATPLAGTKILRSVTLYASTQKTDSKSVIFIRTLLHLVSFIKVLYLNYSDRLSASIKKIFFSPPDYGKKPLD